MKILVTNDDGIFAQGLLSLWEVLEKEHEVFVVAPEYEMSAVGHAITLSTPLRVRGVRRKGRFFGHAVAGTPADCVKIAVQELLPVTPEMVLSGINLGANVGVNVLYSGTVSAATEGAFLGIPSAAISLAFCQDPDFRLAAGFARDLVAFVAREGLRSGTALNVNIPAAGREDIRGVRVTRQGTSRFSERYEHRRDPRGNSYYWLTGETFVEDGDADTDFSALRENWITLTPIHYDLTCPQELGRLRAMGPLPLGITGPEEGA